MWSAAGAVGVFLSESLLQQGSGFHARIFPLFTLICLHPKNKIVVVVVVVNQQSKFRRLAFLLSKSRIFVTTKDYII